MQRRELLSLTKTELIKRCKKAHISTRGGKAELVDRLLAKLSKQKFQKAKQIKSKTKNRMKSSNKTKRKKSTKRHQKANTINIASTTSFQTTLFQPQQEYDLQRDIVSELERFNYATSDIITAMNHVVDKNDINAIMSYIEKKKINLPSSKSSKSSKNKRVVPPKPASKSLSSKERSSTSNKRVSKSSQSKSHRHKPQLPQRKLTEETDDSSISVLSPRLKNAAQMALFNICDDENESDISAIDEVRNGLNLYQNKDESESDISSMVELQKVNVVNKEDDSESDSDISSIENQQNELNAARIIRNPDKNSSESDTSSVNEEQIKSNDQSSSDSDISSIDEEPNVLSHNEIRNIDNINSSDTEFSSASEKQTNALNGSRITKISTNKDGNSMTTSDTNSSSDEENGTMIRRQDTNSSSDEENDTMIRKQDENSSESDLSSVDNQQNELNDKQQQSSTSEASEIEEEESEDFTPKPSRSNPTISLPEHNSILSISTHSAHTSHSHHVHIEEKKYDTLRVEVDMPYIDDDMLGSLPFLTPSKRPSICVKSPRIPNKLDMVEKLQAMQFCMDRILRAFKVYERNYGTRYNINGLIELIQRLRAKDLSTHKKVEEKIDLMHLDQNAFDHNAVSFVASHNKSVHIKSPKLYIPHMTLSEGGNMYLFDNIDHRDLTGRFCVATIIAIDPNNSSNMRIHYEDDLEDVYDLWSDYRVELFRFAKHRSVSRRRQHLFVEELKIGDTVNVNPPKYYVEKSGLKKRTQWIDAMVTAFDKKSAQVQVAHKSNSKWFVYWTHVDNLHEISKYSEKSALPSSFYKFKQDRKQYLGDRKHAQHYGQSASVGQLHIGGINLFNR